MKFIYNFGIRVYAFLICIAALFNEKAKLRYKGGKEALPYLKKHIQANAKYVWFHASSLGEFEQGRPVMEEVRARYPNYQIVLTFFSPSGYTVRHNYLGADLVCYLPMDTPRNARAFVQLIHPEVAFFIKYEFWANFIFQLDRANIPLYIFSSIFRKNQVFFRWYGSFFLNLLSRFKMIFVQDESSEKLLKSYGVSAVEIAGDTRFDRVCQIASQAKHLPIAEAFSKDAKVLVCGSTWPPDEALIIPFMNSHPEYKLLIASHEVHQSRLDSICKAIDEPYVSYSTTTPQEAQEARCLVVDCIGVLSSLYQYGQVAYIGGGFGVGIHNTLEAAVWGLPVVFGPNYQRFKEARELIACGGAFSIETSTQFAQEIEACFMDPERGDQARHYVDEHRGATTSIINFVFKA